MKFLVYIIAFFLLWSCQHPEKPSLDNKTKVIAFMGSSVCKRSDDEEGLGYAGRFGRRLDTLQWKYINVSRSGDNTIKITPRLETDLYPRNPDYVVIGLSLSNEGISKPLTEEGRYRIIERFRTGILRLADSIRAHGAVPVIAGCYANMTFDERHYSATRYMNSIINEWPMPSINLLGAVDDGTGKWAEGHNANKGHPNKFGHEEMSRAIPPTLFDALEAGKPVPYRNWSSDHMKFFDMKAGTPVLQVKPDTLVHSFAESFMFNLSGEGVIASIESQTGIGVIKVEKGKVFYTSDAGSASVSLPTDSLDGWNYLTLSHRYAKGETFLVINGKESAHVKEKLKPGSFMIGGFGQNTATMPDTLCVKDWMIHRSSLAQDEAKDYMEWKMLRSSLEVYAPLADDSVTAGSLLQNKAQTLTEVELNEKAEFRVVKLGLIKYI